MTRVGCWFALPDGAVSGVWLRFSENEFHSFGSFCAVLAHASSIGAVAVWCET